jgi:hypothetical protein
MTQKKISFRGHELTKALKNGIDPPINLKAYQQTFSNIANVPQFFLIF